MRNKYQAQKTNGFASKLEAALYDHLLLKERAGEISEIRQQHCVVLADGGTPAKSVRWKIDFSYLKEGITYFAEAKGIETSDYKIKLKLFKINKIGPITIYKANYRKGQVQLFIAEEFNP